MVKSSNKLAAVKAVSVAVDLSEEIARKLRVEAALNDLSPQDQLRKTIGLPFKKPQRPRISLSLRPGDYDYLGKRYGLAEDARNEIKKAILAELSTILQAKT